MTRLTSILALCLFALTSCQEATKTMDTAKDAMEEAPQAIANTATEVKDMVKGESFEIKTVDGTIKSPRKELTGKVAEVPVTINYGSPAVNERTIYGELVPYNKVWRTGANEATRITFDEPVMVGSEGKKLEAGTYALFTMPASKTDWTIIFNKKADQWGAYDYNEKDDVLKIKGSAMESGQNAERMDFAVENENVKMMWADLVVSFPVKGAAK